jgi:hypothetical protein
MHEGCVLSARGPSPGKEDLAVHPLVTASTILLAGFVVLSMVDGLYIHLWRLRLHARPGSYREHLWHTARAILFAPAVMLVFAAPTAGLALWIGVALLAVDQIVEMLDVLAERASRASLGGLASAEYAVHVALVTLRAAAVALALASRPAGAWSLDAAPAIAAYPDWITTLVHQLVPGAVAAAGLHVWLAWRHRPATRAPAVVA